MTAASANRHLGRLTAPEIAEMRAESVLCLPIGSYEQHGPHLPVCTDTIIAEQFTRRIVERYGDADSLWALPAIPYGLAQEHAWSSGTISLTMTVLTGLLDTLCGELVRATPARNLLIVNGHGGNRGVLEAAVYELSSRHGIRVCVIHPSSLSAVRSDSPLPEVHAGLRETSVILALSPDDVHLDRLPRAYAPDRSQADAIRRTVIDRGTTWPWRSDDPAISSLGIMGGDPREASVDLGERIVSSALDACQEVLSRLVTSR